MMPALEIRDLWCAYRRHCVLSALDLNLSEGCVAGIIGPNGAGKTSLLRCISGELSPRTGTVRLFGEDVCRMPARMRAGLLGVVPQHVEIPVAFTVEEIVGLGRIARGPGRNGGLREDRRVLDHAMALTDVLDLRDRDFARLSGGEQQRVILAMALAQSPRMLMLDEGAAHLDLNHRQELLQIIDRLNRESGLTILLVTHDLDFAAACCDTLLLLKDGRLVANGAPQDVLTESRVAEIFGCEVHVERGGRSGLLHVSPAPRTEACNTGTALCVHVIGGGGCAHELLRRLTLSGYIVTTGVLNSRDSDADIAQALDIPCALEAPFAPIGDAAFEIACRMVREACAVILAPAPMGPGNTRNLELAALGRRLGKTVLLVGDVVDRDFTPGKTATALAKQVEAAGAESVSGWREALARLPVREPPGCALRGRFPFRLGATSYIIPAGILPNVRALSGRVDDVQLLVFESPDADSLPLPSDVEELRGFTSPDHGGLSFSVHLPMNAYLGHSDPETRAASVAAVGRIWERLRPLDPTVWVAHAAVDDDDALGPSAPNADLPGWLARLESSLRALIDCGMPRERLALETLHYPFDILSPLITRLDLAVCLDVGHLLMLGEDPLAFVDRYFDRIRCIHLHGLRGGRDHGDLSGLPPDVLRRLVKRLMALAKAGPLVVTVEVFNEADLNRSLEILESFA